MILIYLLQRDAYTQVTLQMKADNIDHILLQKLSTKQHNFSTQHLHNQTTLLNTFMKQYLHYTTTLPENPTWASVSSPFWAEAWKVEEMSMCIHVCVWAWHQYYRSMCFSASLSRSLYLSLSLFLSRSLSLSLSLPLSLSLSILEVGGVSPTGKSFRFVRACERARRSCEGEREAM